MCGTMWEGRRRQGCEASWCRRVRGWMGDQAAAPWCSSCLAHSLPWSEMLAQRFTPLQPAGKYRPGDETNAGVQPTATCTDFPAAVEWILQQNAAAAAAGPA